MPDQRLGALNHPDSLEILARLVHAESGTRVVEVRARQGSRWLGSALGEATTAELAEERALARLLERLERGAPPAQLPFPSPPPAPKPSAPAPRPSVPTPKPSAPAPKPTTASVAASEPSADDDAASEPAAAIAATTPHPEESAPIEPPADPEDWSAELARLDLELRRLGWSREQEETYLKRAFGHPSRSRLTAYADLSAYLNGLAALPPASDPTSAPVPLRRRDLLLQGEQLISQLGWSADQGRLFLKEQLGASSRQRLNETQLLQFNMLLEGELLSRDPAGSGEVGNGDGKMASPPASALP